MANRQDLQNDADAPRLDSVVARVRGEYSEMPGLQLTCAQACRRWHMHVSTCEQLLEQLVQEFFLVARPELAVLLSDCPYIERASPSRIDQVEAVTRPIPRASDRNSRLVGIMAFSDRISLLLF